MCDESAWVYSESSHYQLVQDELAVLICAIVQIECTGWLKHVGTFQTTDNL